MDFAKIALFLIMTLLAIVIFFALTGLDVRNPMPAVERILRWVADLNRTINARIQAFFYRIRTRFFGGAAVPGNPGPSPGIDHAAYPLERLGEAPGNLFQGFLTAWGITLRKNLSSPSTPETRSAS